MRKGESHVEEKEERSTREKNLAVSIAFLRDKSQKYSTGIATTFILMVCKQKAIVQVLIWFSEIQVKVQIAITVYSYSLPHARMRKGVKQLALSVCQFVSLSVCQSSEKFLNLNIDKLKWFPNMTVTLTL